MIPPVAVPTHSSEPACSFWITRPLASRVTTAALRRSICFSESRRFNLASAAYASSSSLKFTAITLVWLTFTASILLTFLFGFVQISRG